MKKIIEKLKINKKQKQVLIFFITLIIITSLFILIYNSLGFGKKDSEIIKTDNKEELTDEENSLEGLARRKIDGVYVEEGKENFYPITIMIENMIDARPQSGLSKANLIYEALVEAGITRFLAVYASDEDVEEIGPVRSARPYYLDWAAEFASLYIHSGGSPESLTLIPKSNIYDLNEFWNDQYFWRRNSRLAPHNLYTSSELLNKALEDKVDEESNYESWLYKEEKSLEERSLEEQEVMIDYSTYTYRVEWKYDKENNDYVRYQAGSIHKDIDGTEIKAKNIVVMYLKTWVIDAEWRRKMETIGSGQAVVFRDGEAIEGEWKKESKGSRTRFYDQDGLEIEFNTGTTWIQVVPTDYEVSY